MVTVSVPNGQAGSQLRVEMNEQSESGKTVLINSRTNLNGIVRQCGFTPNHQVRVTVFGPRGAVWGSKMTTLAAGKNFMDLSVTPPRQLQNSGDDGTMPGRRKRP